MRLAIPAVRRPDAERTVAAGRGPLPVLSLVPRCPGGRQSPPIRGFPGALVRRASASATAGWRDLALGRAGASRLRHRASPGQECLP